jgi:dGTPase
MIRNTGYVHETRGRPAIGYQFANTEDRRMLEWRKLLDPRRRKELHDSKEPLGTGAARTEIERDYDRILFAAPTRRLADKTQVFPMEENDSIRTRLTHSHEVSNLARSIGVQLAFNHAERVFGPEHESLNVKRNIPSLLAAVGLAHDLGNPPFGHQGELAIQQWFQALAAQQGSSAVPIDFLSFDGNAQTFRLMTRLHVLNDEFGLNLTLATLAALVKYPVVYGSPDKHGFKKYGIFASEEAIIEEVWRETGLRKGIRHPLAYIMEACDDIAYSIIDAEDTVKKGYASFYDLMDFLKHHGSADDLVTTMVVEASEAQNKKFKEEDLSSRELNDISMQMFRVKAISEMVQAATEKFVDTIDEIMAGTVEDFELIRASRCAQLCKAAKDFDKRHGYQNREVLELELQGNNYIQNAMSMLWRAISNDEKPGKPFERYVFGEISENYRRAYKAAINRSGADLDYAQYQLLCDAISGMTETYLIRKHEEFRRLDSAFKVK